MTTIGLITVGQAPRSDVVPDMAAILGADVEIVEAGALDGLAREEITPLAPEGDDEVDRHPPSRRLPCVRRQVDDDPADRGQDRRTGGAGHRPQRAPLHGRVPQARGTAALP